MAAYMHRKQTRLQHIHFDEQEPNMNCQLTTPDWDAVERDVMVKLQYLRAIWEHTASAEPELHELMKRDLYMPVC
jgi:hypothetical protein